MLTNLPSRVGLLCITVLCISSICAQTRVLKCVGQDGSVSFVDSKSCPGDVQGSERVIEEHKVTLTPGEISRNKMLEQHGRQVTAAEQEESLRRFRDWARSVSQRQSVNTNPGVGKRPELVSYRCTRAPKVWYSHSRCPEVNRRQFPGRDARGQILPFEKDIIMEVVPRAFACDEMHSPKALLRVGHGNDDRVNVYEKLKGKDPCKL